MKQVPSVLRREGVGNSYRVQVLWCSLTRSLPSSSLQVLALKEDALRPRQVVLFISGPSCFTPQKKAVSGAQ